MNKKLLFAAMALPMLFTACSQDELIEEVSGGIEAPKVQGYYVTLNPTLGGEMTRAQWVDANYKLTWDPTDKISVYWLNDQATVGKNLKANFNSVFKTSDGSGFTSESLVYEGGNVAVFPGNTNVTSIQDIKLTVDNPQDASTILETPYISNLVTVSKKSQQSAQVAGYNNGLYAPMKMAANVVVFDFTLKNTADLVKNHGFKIEEVSLVTKKFFAAKTETDEETGKETEISAAELKDVNAFTNEATLQIEDGVTPKDQKKVTYYKDKNNPKAEFPTITQSLYAKGTPSVTSLVAKEIKTIDEAAGKYQVKFVILPTDAGDFDENSEIVIKTNCGRINLTSTETVNKVTTKVAEFKKVGEGETAPAVAGAIYNVGSKETWTITQMLKQVLKARTMEKDQKSNFEGEIVGRPYACQFTADMKDATLDKSEVYSSDDIIKYVNIHADMKSEEVMTLLLSSKKDSKVFDNLTRTAIDMINSRNGYNKDGSANDKTYVKLAFGKNSKEAPLTTVKIVDGGDVYFGQKGMWAMSAIAELGASSTAWTMNDNFTHNNISQINVLSGATLKVAGKTSKVNDKDVQNVLATSVANAGTLEIAGNNTLIVGNKLTNTGTVKVAKGQDLRFNVSNTTTNKLGGTIEVAVDAFLTVEKDINLYSNATIKNSGVVSSIAGNGGIHNSGTISVLDDGAITYIQENTGGTINLKNRADEVKVQGDKGTIIYNYNFEKDKKNFTYTVADKFTKVIFKLDTEELYLPAYDDISAIDMEFQGTTEIFTNGQTIRDLVVASGAHLKLTTPTQQYNKKLNVANVTNKGNITIGGYIIYETNYTNEGTVRSVGDGAITKKPATPSTGDTSTSTGDKTAE